MSSLLKSRFLSLEETAWKRVPVVKRLGKGANLKMGKGQWLRLGLRGFLSKNTLQTSKHEFELVDQRSAVQARFPAIFVLADSSDYPLIFWCGLLQKTQVFKNNKKKHAEGLVIHTRAMLRQFFQTWRPALKTLGLDPQSPLCCRKIYYENR